MDISHAQKIANLLQQVKALTKDSQLPLDYRYHDRQLAEFNSVLLMPEPASLRLPIACDGNYSNTKAALLEAMESVRATIAGHIEKIKAM